MSDDTYTPPPGSERAAEMQHRGRVEMDRARDRLNDAPIEQLERVLHDPGESLEARYYALGVLQERLRPPAMTEALLRLFDDPRAELWQMAIASYCRSELLRSRVPAEAWIDPDPRVLARLRGMRDETDDQSWSAAACALARVRDDSILPKALEWLDRGDEPHRNVAIECLVHIGNLADLPHVFTADGIHEARLWVDQRLRQPGGPTLFGPPPDPRSHPA